MTKFRIAALSRWHVHADDYVRDTRARNDSEVAAVWDEDPARGAAWGSELGVAFEPDLAALLKRADIDAVTVTTPTNMHRDVIVAAANAGKHIFTEKVLAITVADARAIAESVQRAGVCFCISFPRQAIAPLRLAKQMIDAGEVGTPSVLRIRVAHDGALRDWLPAHFYDAHACGGGAMIDLGAHGMYLSAWLLGEPVRITSTFTSVTGRAVEDNAVSVIEFASGAIAINETSFVSGGGVFSVDLDGSEGALRMTAPRDPVLVRSARRGDVRSWQPAELPPPSTSPMAAWFAAMADPSRHRSDTAFEFGLSPAVRLTALMEAAYRSHRERRAVTLAEVYGA